MDGEGSYSFSSFPPPFFVFVLFCFFVLLILDPFFFFVPFLFVFIFFLIYLPT